MCKLGTASSDLVLGLMAPTWSRPRCLPFEVVTTDMGAEKKEFGLGEGPVAKVSVSLRAGNIRAVRKRVGGRGFSAYVDAAVERQIERDLLEEALEANEAASGPIPRFFRDEAADLFRAAKQRRSCRRALSGAELEAGRQAEREVGQGGWCVS